MIKIYRLPDTFQKSTGSVKTTSIIYNTPGTNQFSVPDSSNPYPYPPVGSTLPPTVPAEGYIETPEVVYGYAVGVNTPFKSRFLPIQEKLFNILLSAAKVARVKVKITSGGQRAIDESPSLYGEYSSRTGSTRHDHGYAADVQLSTKFVNLNATEAAISRISAGGTSVDTDKLPLVEPLSVTTHASICLKFAEACFQAGATAIGAGPNYMGGTAIHVDIAYGATTQSLVNHWGDNETSDGAVGWLKELAKKYPIKG